MGWEEGRVVSFWAVKSGGPRPTVTKVYMAGRRGGVSGIGSVLADVGLVCCAVEYSSRLRSRSA